MSWIKPVKPWASSKPHLFSERTGYPEAISSVKTRTAIERLCLISRPVELECAMNITVTCPDCNISVNVPRQKVFKSGKAPKCEICGTRMELPDDVADEIASQSKPSSKKCSVCKSPMPQGTQFCAKCGSSGNGGDARERAAAANFQLEQDADRRIAWAQFGSFLFRLFHWF